MKVELSEIKQDTFDDETDTQATAQQRRFRRHFGHNWCFLYFKGEPLITIGPHWPLSVCMIMTFVLSSYFVIAKVAIKKSIYHQIIMVIVATLQIISYMLTALKNPGIVTATQEMNGILQCVVCNNPRAIGALYHCEDCDVCVRGYDHHCPWTGKCIARGNLSPFYVFISMIPIYIITCLVVLLS